MHFKMSFRFNKTTPGDFGLMATKDPNIFTDIKDGSLWVCRDLIDLGWGSEIGYYKQPQLNFDELLCLALSEENDEDFYGSIAILYEDFPNQLLDVIEERIKNRQINPKHHKLLFKTLRGQMTLNEAILARSNDKNNIPYFRRWKKIFEICGIN